jgi:hypothetical protein
MRLASFQLSGFLGEAETMQYFEVVQDGPDGGHWHIHPVQCQGNIELEGAIFFGPQGKRRAEQYAQWMSAQRQESTVAVSSGG